ncbi:hypothetical protein C0993_003616 [Termitomyces sp. T159_Od127]|nr:hypothetical protein C0993_003616 [Termitomyces sp. T159_Od127]
MRTNMLLMQVQGLGAEAPQNKVKGMMHLWQKWWTMWRNRITWERDGELLEWCMVHYRDHLGTEWLAPFANDFAPVAPSFDEELEALLADEEPLVISMAAKSKEAIIAPLMEEDLWCQDKFWQEVAKGSEADAQRCITNSLEALVQKGLGLEEATGAGEELRQGQEKEEGAKKKMPKTTAGAATEAVMPAAIKAFVGGAKELALSAKKMSSTKLASKRRGCQALKYEAPTQQDFSNKELACLLVPRQLEVVVDMEMEAGVVLKETKSKATVDLATCQAFKKSRERATSAG